MKRIPLTKGKFALVDDEDYDVLKKYKWHAVQHPGGFWRVKRFSRVDEMHKPPKLIEMHHQIFGSKKGFGIKHIDKNGLNNQRVNLCYVTKAEAQWSKKKSRKSKGKYLGVYWCTPSSKWVATFQRGNFKKQLGCFFHEEDAYAARLKAENDFIESNNLKLK